MAATKDDVKNILAQMKANNDDVKNGLGALEGTMYQMFTAYKEENQERFERMEKRTEELEMKMQAAMEGKAMQVDAEDGDQQVMAKVRELEEKFKEMRKQSPAMQVVVSKRRATSAGPVEDIGEEKEPVVVIKGLKESMWREDAEILFTPFIDARAGLGTYEMLIHEGQIRRCAKSEGFHRAMQSRANHHRARRRGGIPAESHLGS